MGAWMIFLKERFPLPAYLLLGGGLALSGWSFLNAPPSPMTVVAFALIILFFLELRIMDEVKDYKKDQIANPTRPLPRGALSLGSAQKAIRILISLMMLSSIGLLAQSLSTALIYALVTLHLWLMYREFYVGEWLEKRMLLYAATHQAILIPLCFFAVAVHDPFDAVITGFLSTPTLAWSLMVLGAFFSYEVCRKLDPKAHPILRTYPQVYGLFGSGLLVLFTSLLSLGGVTMLIQSQNLGWVGSLSVAFGALTPITYFMLMVISKKTDQFKIVELVATLALAVQIWTPVLARMLV